jgi:hypothetical protein
MLEILRTQDNAAVQLSLGAAEEEYGGEWMYTPLSHATAVARAAVAEELESLTLGTLLCAGTVSLPDPAPFLALAARGAMPCSAGAVAYVAAELLRGYGSNDVAPFADASDTEQAPSTAVDVWEPRLRQRIQLVYRGVRQSAVRRRMHLAAALSRRRAARGVHEAVCR